MALLGVAGCATMTHPEITTSFSVPPSRPLHRWALPNGLVVLFQEDHSAPLVALDALVKTGSATEGAWAGTGVSHVVEHMLFKGTATRPVGAIEREVKSYGGQINGHTTHDVTGYTLTIHRDHFPEALTLLADALQHPSFDPQELTRELDVVFRELKLRRDDPDQSMADLIWAAAYREHPYRIPIVGYEPLLRALTRQQVVDYYRAHYAPNRTVLAIVGDADPAAVRAAATRELAGWPRGLEPPVVTPAEPPPVAPRQVDETADVAVAQLAIVFPGVAVTDPNLVALDTLARVLGEGRGSRLDVALREPGIVHDVAGWNYTPREPGLFAITMHLDPSRISEAQAATHAVIAELQRRSVTSIELAAAKRAVIAQDLFGRQTVGAQAGDLAVNEALAGDPRFSQHYVEAVQQVEAEAVQRVARDYLASSRAIQVTLRRAPAPEEIQGQPQQGAAPSADSSLERITLSNGVRVLLREDPRYPIVTLRITAFGGLLHETEAINGVSTMTARMLLRGTASRSAQELTELVRSLGGELASASGRNSVGVSLALLRDDVATGMTLLSDIWHHPAFPADEFLKEQRLLQAEIAQTEDDLFPWGRRRLMRALFAEHPYALPPEGTAESVARLTVADAAACHRVLASPRRTVVSLFGDVRKADVLPLLERAFGQPAAEVPPPAARPPLAPLASRRRVTGVWPRAEAIVLIGFRGVSVTDPDFAAVDVLDAVLGGSGGRLFTEVRERKGLAYTVGSTVSTGPDPGSIVLYAVTDPSQADAVVATLLKEVARLRAAGVTADELSVAQEGVIGAQGIQLQTNGALSLATSLDELFAVGWRRYQAYPAQVRGVTVHDLRRVAERYLTPDRCVVFIGRPSGTASGTGYKLVPGTGAAASPPLPSGERDGVRGEKTP
ncbi:MAG: insulinase family protein [Candidatus Omnitrophica bacterium]|nr:insulinase family protein [Candidatus Omnitrophota bacterium]